MIRVHFKFNEEISGEIELPVLPTKGDLYKSDQLSEAYPGAFNKFSKEVKGDFLIADTLMVTSVRHELKKVPIPTTKPPREGEQTHYMHIWYYIINVI